MLRFKKMGCIVVAMVIMFTLIGCYKDVDKKYDGFSQGFNYEIRSGTYCAARSEKTEFDVDNVTLDFYFGWWKESGVPDILRQVDFSCIALYFGNTSFEVSMDVNYKDVENVFFIDEVSLQAFVTEDYEMTMTQNGGRQFKQFRNLTVPKELFDKKIGEFTFLIFFVWENDNGFSFSYQSYMIIHYKYNENNKIVLY